MSNCKIFLGAKIELAPDEWGALQSIKSTEFYKKLGYFFINSAKVRSAFIFM